MLKTEKYKIPADYWLMFCIFMLLCIAAFVWDSPQKIFYGLYKINISRSVLITDYTALAGIGATLINSAIQLILALIILVISKSKPDGRIITAIFLTIGFSLFGKNLFNTIPIITGIWIYGYVTKIKFSDLAVWAMVGTTVSPIISEIAFFDGSINFIKIIISYGVGIFVGLIFPLVMDNIKGIHKNFCLYKAGIAGGFIATMVAGLLRSLNMKIIPENYWNTDSSNSFYLTILSFIISFGLIIYGIITEKSAAFEKFKKLTDEKNQNSCDYFAKYQNTAYINVGIMCITATVLMLFLKIPVNGPVLGGILTIAGFGAAGKHLKNVIPILVGSIMAAGYFNHLELTAPVNALAILFSTGLAPVAGRYGWHWGVIIGFFHVSIAIFIGDVNGGLNLYNNGFAGAFVLIMILPLIVVSEQFFIKEKNK